MVFTFSPLVVSRSGMSESDPFFDFYADHRRRPTKEEWSAVFNGHRVAVWALAEVGRLDLAQYIHGEVSTRSIVPHFDAPWERDQPEIPLEDLALIERAMAIGFKTTPAKYHCATCDEQFEIAGVKKSDLDLRA